MKSVVKLVLPILFFILIIATPSLALKPEASIDMTYPTLYGWTVPYGQKIAFKVKICVKAYSPAPLDGFYIKMTIRKPNGETSVAELTKYDIIYPGECREYIFKLNQRADQVGTWSYIIVLFTRDRQYKLDIDEGYFEVVESGGGGLPVAKMEILKIDGNVGEKIKVSVKICVEKLSPTSLNGFRLIMSFVNPDNNIVYAEWKSDDIIYPGQCRVYTIETNAVADKAGTWKYIISLCTKGYPSHLLDFKQGTFEVEGVTPAPPVAEVEVLDIVGYATTASMIGAGLALVLSRIIK